MPREPNHQVQGMWMLMLRTTSTELKRDCWFLVNGRLIRYSIREHALLTGLNCIEYPANWENLGSLDFAQRIFKKSKGIKVGAVEEKLVSMKNKKPSADRMKLAVLYFLCKVLKAKNKHDPTVDQFLLRIVNDLSVCETFPWGRYTFNDCVDGVKGLVENMNRVVKNNSQTGFSGFIIPPEILAFECIPVLGRKFREDVTADSGCPRMCKRKFVKGDNRGFSLDEINAVLGDSKEIISILQPTPAERALMRQIVEDDVDDGIGFIDPVVESWKERVLVQKKEIFWPGWYEKDVESRAPKMIEGVEGVAENENNVEHPLEHSIQSMEARIMKEMDNGFGILKESLDRLSIQVIERLSIMETRVQVLQTIVVGRVTEHGGTPHSGFVLYSTPPNETTPLEVLAKFVADMAPQDVVGEKGNEMENEGGIEHGETIEKEKEEKKQKKEEKKRKEREEKKGNEGKKLTRKKRALVRYTPGVEKNRKNRYWVMYLWL